MIINKKVSSNKPKDVQDEKEPNELSNKFKLI